VTATRIRPHPATAHHLKSHPGRPIIVAAFIGSITMLIRLALHVRGFDLYGDEVIYTNLGRSVISGGFPNFEGQAFFLHGPAYFYLEAGWARLMGNPPGLMPWVYEMRALNALLAGITAVALVLLANRASSLRVGAVVGLLFAFDPFCIRQNDRVLLETAMMLWVMLGYLVFTCLVGRQPSRRDWPYAIGAGLLFGCAVLTKDEGALLTLVPLLASAALRWGPRRTMALLTAGTTGAVYAVYVAIVVANGQFSALWGAKTSGIKRMLGLLQITGFNSSGGGSLSSRLIAEIGSFATTYTALALAVPALMVIVRYGDPLQRLLGLLYCAAGITLGYALVYGTLEEQELYLLIVPSLLIIPVATKLLMDRRSSRSGSHSRRSKGPIAIITVVLAFVVCFNLATCIRWLRQPDDAFVQLLRYMATDVPAGTTVTDPTATLNSASDVAQYALPPRINIDPWLTQAGRSQAHVRYVLVEWGLINLGYSEIPSTQIQHVVSNGRVLFSVSGRSYGKVTLYELPLPRVSAKASASTTEDKAERRRN
jgi:Dolichyl-phosphate-mannose-protein mannosyltransferase